MYERLLRAVFECNVAEITIKDVQLFCRFLDNCKSINQNNFKDFLKNDVLKAILNDTKDIIIHFCKKELKKKIIRDDCRELLEFSTIYFGASNDINIPGPGPTHHANCVSKAIYCLKVYLCIS